MSEPYVYNEGLTDVTTTSGGKTWRFVFNGKPVTESDEVAGALNRLIVAAHDMGWERGFYVGMGVCLMCMFTAAAIVLAIREWA